jgi:hypothetical protein
MEMARSFNKLNAEGGHGPKFLSDHPNPENHEHAIQQEARVLPERRYGSETGDFKHMKEALSKIREPRPKNPTTAESLRAENHSIGERSAAPLL